MSPHPRRDDLPPDLPDDEAAAFLLVAERLERERPLPAAAFRGNLARHLSSSAGRRISPRRLRVLVGAYSAAGCLLLALPTIGVLGAGPFKAEGERPDETAAAENHDKGHTGLRRSLR